MVIDLIPEAAAEPWGSPVTVGTMSLACNDMTPEQTATNGNCSSPERHTRSYDYMEGGDIRVRRLFCRTQWYLRIDKRGKVKGTQEMKNSYMALNSAERTLNVRLKHLKLTSGNRFASITRNMLYKTLIDMDRHFGKRQKTWVRHPCFLKEWDWDSSTVGFEMTELDLNKKNRRRSPRSRGTLVSSIVEGQGVNGQCFQRFCCQNRPLGGKASARDQRREEERRDTLGERNEEQQEPRGLLSICVSGSSLASSILESIRLRPSSNAAHPRRSELDRESCSVTEHQGHLVFACYVCSHELEKFQMFSAF
ncbi:hypothetical protein ACRRTK_013781 [Alexandromys fortis]